MTAYWFIVCTSSLIGLGFVILCLFGLRNLFRGKHSLFAVISIFVPLVVFGICYVVASGSPDQLSLAALLTVVVMIGLAVLGLLVSGLRGITG
jgi:hypothetical protein